MHTQITCTDASDIELSSSAPEPASAPPAEASTLDHYRLILGIRRMLKCCKAEDRNTQAMMAITALIEAGVNNGPHIVRFAKALGFDPAHFGAFLKKSTGSVKGHHLWQRNSNGTYEVLGEAGEPQIVTVPHLFA